MDGNSCLLPSSIKEAEAHNTVNGFNRRGEASPLNVWFSHLGAHQNHLGAKCLRPGPCPGHSGLTGWASIRPQRRGLLLLHQGRILANVLMILFYRILTPVILCLRLQHTLERKGLEIRHGLLRAGAYVGLRAHDSQPWSPPNRMWGYRQTWI